MASAPLAAVVFAALGGLAAGAAARGARQDARPPAALDGSDWKQYSSRERQAYLNGFLAGAATMQAALGADTGSGASVSAGIARLRAEKRLAYPFAPSVYSAQLDDHYFYADRVSQPLVDVLASVNRRMMRPPAR